MDSKTDSKQSEHNWRNCKVDLNKEEGRKFFIENKDKVVNVKTRKIDHEKNPLGVNWSQIVELDCNSLGISRLPELPNCEYLTCIANRIEELPELPNCIKLICCYNKLTKLPSLPKCEMLLCESNYLTELPPLKPCTCLSCWCNMLKEDPRITHSHIGDINCKDYQTDKEYLDRFRVNAKLD
jgi:hypothetical protein